VNRRIESQPIGTPKKAPTKYTLSTTPAAGSERWNRCARVTNKGPKSEEIIPKTTRSSVALVSGSGRNVTSVEAGPGSVDEFDVKGSSHLREDHVVGLVGEKGPNPGIQSSVDLIRRRHQPSLPPAVVPQWWRGHGRRDS